GCFQTRPRYPPRLEARLAPRIAGGDSGRSLRMIGTSLIGGALIDETAENPARDWVWTCRCRGRRLVHNDPDDHDLTDGRAWWPVRAAASHPRWHRRRHQG